MYLANCSTLAGQRGVNAIIYNRRSYCNSLNQLGIFGKGAQAIKSPESLPILSILATFVADNPMILTPLGAVSIG
jgi:hypothetical protein